VRFGRFAGRRLRGGFRGTSRWPFCRRGLPNLLSGHRIGLWDCPTERGCIRAQMVFDSLMKRLRGYPRQDWDGIIKGCNGMNSKLIGRAGGHNG